MLLFFKKEVENYLDTMLSNFKNNMEEDIRSTIFVLKNYEGENLGEFRQNLDTYGAVKFFSDGGLETLHIEVNSENYKAIVELMKNESQVITDIKNSVGVISEETRVANHQWIDDPKKELERVKAEKAEQTTAYINTDSF